MKVLRSVPVVAAVALLLAACSSADPSADPTGSSASAVEENDGPDVHAHVQWQKGAKGSGGSAASPLVDHGGRVLSTSNTYAIWWGTQSAFPSDAKAGIDALMEGMNGSSFLGIASQYMRGASISSSFHTNLIDSTTAPPSRPPSTATIVNEACSVIGANGLAPDPTALYIVYTSNFPSGHTSYCAWHDDGTCNGVTIQVAYMPNTTGLAGCDPGDLYGCNTYSQGTRSLANVTSHEFMEAVTDPDINAWLDNSGSEIGDKCAWQFSSCVNLGSGNSWQLQKEWSNSASGCVQQ
jgi:hypothetical protein